MPSLVFPSFLSSPTHQSFINLSGTVNESRKQPMVPQVQFTRRYSLLRGLSSSSCGRFRPTAEASFTLRAKKRFVSSVFAYSRPFLCSVVTSVTFSRRGFNISPHQSCQPNRNHFTNVKWIIRWKGIDGITLHLFPACRC